MQVGRAQAHALSAGIVAVVAGLLLQSSSMITGGPDQRDARHYVSVGLHLARSGQFGISTDDPVTMYREPLTSWLIALQIRIDPRLQGLLGGELTLDDSIAAHAIKQQNLIWAAVLLGAVIVLARALSGGAPRRSAAVGISAAILTHAAFLAAGDVMDRSLNELPAAALVTVAAVVGVRFVDTIADPEVVRWKMRAAALGVALGALALTKAVFLFVGPIAISLIGLLLISKAGGVRKLVRRCSGPKRAAAATLVALVAFTLVVGPWLIRNEVHFGEVAISSRGGLGLWSRSVKNGMADDELRAAFVVYSPGPLRAPIARIVGADVTDTDLASPFRRVDRYSYIYPHGPAEATTFYLMARADRSRLTAEIQEREGLAWSPASTLADSILRDRALERLRQDPLASLRTLPAFLWRGTWPLVASELLPVPLLGPLNPAGMFALVGGAFIAILRRRTRLAAVVLPSAGMVAFYALFSHYEARFTRPAVPIMLVLLAVLTAGPLTQRIATLRSDRSLAPRSQQ